MMVELSVWVFWHIKEFFFVHKFLLALKCCILGSVAPGVLTSGAIEVFGFMSEDIWTLYLC